MRYNTKYLKERVYKELIDACESSSIDNELWWYVAKMCLVEGEKPKANRKKRQGDFLNHSEVLLSLPEIKKISYRFWMIIMIVYYLGVEISSVVGDGKDFEGLKVRDIDFDNRIVTFRERGGYCRKYILEQWLIDEIGKYVFNTKDDRAKDGSDYVFLKHDGKGGGVKKGAIWVEWSDKIKPHLEKTKCIRQGLKNATNLFRMCPNEKMGGNPWKTTRVA